MMSATAALILTLVMQAGPLPVAGVWRITYPWHIGVKDGVVTPVMETGQLTVEARADSIIAILRKDAGSAGRPTLRLAAPRSTADTVVFVTRDKVSLTSSGATQETTAVSTWVF